MKESIKSLKKNSFLVVPVLFGCVGVFILNWADTQNALATRSRHWPSVTGQIISSSVHKGTGKNRGCWPKVQYEYTVGGINFESERIQFGQNGTGSCKDAVQVVTKYFPRQYATVYYNPEAPQTACLEPGRFASATNWAYFVGVLFILYGFFFGGLPLLGCYLSLSIRRSVEKHASKYHDRPP